MHPLIQSLPRPRCADAASGLARRGDQPRRHAPRGAAGAAAPASSSHRLGAAAGADAARRRGRRGRRPARAQPVRARRHRQPRHRRLQAPRDGPGQHDRPATLVADELDADWALVRTEYAPSDAKLLQQPRVRPMQGTGGSSAIANSYLQIRSAGATARAMLVAAAAEAWKVPAGEICASKSMLTHASGKRASYGEMARAAAEADAAREPAAEARRRSSRRIGKDRATPRVDSLVEVQRHAHSTRRRQAAGPAHCGDRVAAELRREAACRSTRRREEGQGRDRRRADSGRCRCRRDRRLGRRCRAAAR